MLLLVAEGHNTESLSVCKYPHSVSEAKGHVPVD